MKKIKLNKTVFIFIAVICIVYFAFINKDTSIGRSASYTTAQCAGDQACINCVNKAHVCYNYVSGSISDWYSRPYYWINGACGLVPPNELIKMTKCTGGSCSGGVCGSTPTCISIIGQFCYYGTCASGDHKSGVGTCASPYTCCSPCTSHTSYKCYGNDIWWYDECGNRQDIKQSCSSCISGATTCSVTSVICTTPGTSPTQKNVDDKICYFVSAGNWQSWTCTSSGTWSKTSCGTGNDCYSGVCSSTCDPDDPYLQYCIGNKLYNACGGLVQDCGTNSATCGYEGGFYHCISSSSGTTCDPIFGKNDYCSGNILYYCNSAGTGFDTFNCVVGGYEKCATVSYDCGGATCSAGACMDQPATECTTNANCQSKAPRVYCSQNICVECLSDANCLDPVNPICSGNTCVASGGEEPPIDGVISCCDPKICKITATKPVVIKAENSILSTFTVTNEEACDIDWDLTFFMTTKKKASTAAVVNPTAADCIVGNTRYPAAAIKLKAGDTAEIKLKQDDLAVGTYDIMLYSVRDKCTSSLWSAPFKAGTSVGPIIITGKSCTSDYIKCETGTLKFCKTGESEKIQECASGRCTEAGTECWIDPKKPCKDYESEIICGTDGKTYNNTCYLELENKVSEDTITIDHLGQCGFGDMSMIVKIVLGIIVFIIIWFALSKLV